MTRLKTATGTDEIRDADIAVVMQDTDERLNIEKILKQSGFNVHCFRDEKEYSKAAYKIQFGATLAQGSTSAEVGAVLRMLAHPGKYCLVNGRNAVIDRLGVQSMIGYCIEPGYSYKDLVGTVRQMLREC